MLAARDAVGDKLILRWRNLEFKSNDTGARESFIKLSKVSKKRGPLKYLLTYRLRHLHSLSLHDAARVHMET